MTMHLPTPESGLLMLAMADMSLTPLAIVILLVIGIVILRRLRPSTSSSRIWLPVAALAAGPLAALAYFAADVFLISRDYLTAEDYRHSAVSLLIIGLAGGAIGAVGLWVGDRLPVKRVR